MSDSEPENEVYFKEAEVTVHQIENGQQFSRENEDEPIEKIARSRLSNRADPDDEIIEQSGRVRQDLSRECHTPRSESTIERAVSDMIKMQGEMSEILKNVSDVLVTALGTKKQDYRSNGEIIQQNNNSFEQPETDQVAYRTTPSSEDRRRWSDAERGDHASYENYPRARSHYGGQRRCKGSQHCHAPIKMPTFTGKEDWKVWINRFETIADRQNWTNEEKLDNLLPKLEGSAGDFVFTQLKRDVLRNYKELIREINNRFRVIETPKTFAAKFSRRDQQINETAEQYAAELKRLYDKAHRERDSKTRSEDLVRRFLDGLRDEDLSWEVEYIKEPADIDEAVYHVVNCIQTRKKFRDNGERRRKLVRKTGKAASSYEAIQDRENYNSSDEEQNNYVFRVPMKAEQSKASVNKACKATASKSRDEARGDSEKTTKTTRDSEILSQILQRLNELGNLPQTTLTNPKTDMKKTVRCYSCNQENHFARDCPYKQRRNDAGKYLKVGVHSNGNTASTRPLNPCAAPYQQTLNLNGPTYMAEERS